MEARRRISEMMSQGDGGNLLGEEQQSEKRKTFGFGAKGWGCHQMSWKGLLRSIRIPAGVEMGKLSPEQAWALAPLSAEQQD